MSRDSIAALGRLVLHVGDARGAMLREAAAPERTPLRPHTAPVLLPPRVIHGLLGRQTELTAMVAALDAGIPVELSGPPGIGKTALLRHLGHHERAAAFPDGVLYLSARHQSSIDLLPRLSSAFSEGDPPVGPTNAAIRRVLQRKQGLVLLDDVTLAQNELTDVLAAAPRCAFVIATRKRRLWDNARALALTGLPPEDALLMLEREIERELDDAERTAAADLCAALAGHPLQIRQAAALVRETAIPIERCARAIAPDSLVAELLTTIGDKPRRVLLALSALAGVPLEIPHVGGVAEVTDTEAMLLDLVRRGLVLTTESGYRLADGVADRLRRTDDPTPWVHRAITYFTSWADRQRRSRERLLAASDALVRVQEHACRTRRWGEALRVGRLLEDVLVLAPRWGAWGFVLERSLIAAKAIGDRGVEAWVLHETGTRSVCLGDAVSARRLLGQAASLREELGETAAAAASRENLEFVAVPADDAPAEPPEMSFDDRSEADPPLRHVPAQMRQASLMTETGALLLAILLCAALAAFTYRFVYVRQTFVTPVAAALPDALPPPHPAAPLPEPPATAETPPSTPAPAKPGIRIFTARPGSIVTRRPTDLCYAVTNAARTRIEPGIGDVDATDTLSCRRIAPARTTTYELTAVGRDGDRISQQLVIVVR